MSWTQRESQILASILPDLVAELETNLPALLGKTIEESALLAHDRNGYEDCIRRIKEAAVEQTAPYLSSPFMADLDKFDQPPPDDFPGKIELPAQPPNTIWQNTQGST